jgi:hypothetical protein
MTQSTGQSLALAGHPTAGTKQIQPDRRLTDAVTAETPGILDGSSRTRARAIEATL